MELHSNQSMLDMSQLWLFVQKTNVLLYLPCVAIKIAKDYLHLASESWLDFGVTTK